MDISRSNITAPFLAIATLIAVIALFSLWFIGDLPVGGLPFVGQLNLSFPSIPFYDQIVLALQPLGQRISEAESLPTEYKVVLCIVVPIALVLLALTPMFLWDLARGTLRAVESEPQKPSE